METEERKINPKSLLPVVSVDSIIDRMDNPVAGSKKPRITDEIKDVTRVDVEFRNHIAKHYNGATGSPDTPRQQRTLLAAALRDHKVVEGRLNAVSVSRILQSLDRFMANRTGFIVFHGQLRAPATISEA